MPSYRWFEAVVERAIALLPDEYRRYMGNVVVEVVDLPPRQVLIDMGYDPDATEVADMPFGLYEPLFPDLESPAANIDGLAPARISIYKKPLEAAFPDRRELMVEIRKTVVHEVCHRLGLTDLDLEPFDDHPDPFEPDD